MDLNDRLLAVEKQLDRIEKGLQGNKDCLHHIAQKLTVLVQLRDSDVLRAHYSRKEDKPLRLPTT